MTAGRTVRGWVSWGVVGLIGAVLAWQIVSVGVADHLQADRPSAALSWNASDPDALVAAGEAALDRGAPEEARSLAARALAERPLNVGAVRLLAQAAASAGDQGRANELMDLAWSFSRRDAAVALWRYGHAMAEGRYDDALLAADALMRRSPSAVDTMVRRLIAVSARPEATPALAGRLALNPPWRATFFRELRYVPDQTAGLAILSALAEGPTPPLPDELSPLLSEMAAQGRYRESRAAWIGFLPQSERDARSAVFDGHFKRPAGPAPYGWTVAAAQGGEASLKPTETGPGLQVRADGFGDVQVARQLILLTPGRYRLASSGRVVEGSGVELQWRLICAEDRRELSRLTLRSGPDGRMHASAPVEAPPDCPIQQLSLRTMPQDVRRHSLSVIDWVSIEGAD